MKARWTLLLLLLLGYRPSQPQPTAHVTAGIVFALYHNLYSRCVFLLDSGQRNSMGLEKYQVILSTRKKLSTKSVSAAILTFDEFKESRHLLYCDNRPLYVLLQSDENTRNFLSELSHSPHWGLTSNSSELNTTRPVVKSPVWLLFMDTPELTRFFGSVHIPFNCQFLVARQVDTMYQLTEVYRVAKEYPLLSNWFGDFTGGVLIPNDLEFYDRRNNLTGLTLRAATKDHPPFSIARFQNGNVTLGGFVGRVWGVLERQMNFSTTFAVTLAERESNDDMTAAVSTSHAEFGIGDTTVRFDRLPFVDFSAPLMFTNYRVFIRHPGYKFLRWGSFLSPFHADLWLTELCCMITLAAILSLFHHCVRRFGRPDLEEPYTYTFYNSMFYMWGVFCMQGHDITPKSSGCRVVYLVAYLTAITLMAAYSAALISFLTVNDSNLPFTDVDGLLADGRYQFGVVQNSSAQFLMDISSDKTLYRLATYTKDRSTWPMNQVQGLQRVCDDRFAFMLPMDYAVLYNRNVTCDIVPLPGFDIDVGVALMVSRNSPYKGLVNHNINRMRKSGALQKLLNDARPRKLPKVPNTLTRVDLGDVAPILVALLLGALLASVIMGAERRVRHWLKKVEMRRNNQIMIISYMR